MHIVYKVHARSGAVLFFSCVGRAGTHPDGCLPGVLLILHDAGKMKKKK